MGNITEKRSDPVRKIINIALKRASTVIRNCVKVSCKVTQKCHIQVPKNHVIKLPQQIQQCCIRDHYNTT